MAFRLEWSLKSYHQDQAGCARQRYGLIGFPFTGLKVVDGRPDYRIDSGTIKRGFGWVT